MLELVASNFHGSYLAQEQALGRVFVLKKNQYLAMVLLMQQNLQQQNMFQR